MTAKDLGSSVDYRATDRSQGALVCRGTQGPRNPRTQLQSSALSGGLSHCPENTGQQLDSFPVLTWPASDRQCCLSSRILPWHPLSSRPLGTNPTMAPLPTGPLCPSPGSQSEAEPVPVPYAIPALVMETCWPSVLHLGSDSLGPTPSASEEGARSLCQGPSGHLPKGLGSCRSCRCSLYNFSVLEKTL